MLLLELHRGLLLGRAMALIGRLLRGLLCVVHGPGLGLLEVLYFLTVLRFDEMDGIDHRLLHFHLPRHPIRPQRVMHLPRISHLRLQGGQGVCV